MTDRSRWLAARAIARRQYPNGSDADIESIALGFAADADAAIDAFIHAEQARGSIMVPVDDLTLVLELAEAPALQTNDHFEAATRMRELLELDQGRKEG